MSSGPDSSTRASKRSVFPPSPVRYVSPHPLSLSLIRHCSLTTATGGDFMAGLKILCTPGSGTSTTAPALISTSYPPGKPAIPAAVSVRPTTSPLVCACACGVCPSVRVWRCTHARPSAQGKLTWDCAVAACRYHDRGRRSRVAPQGSGRVTLHEGGVPRLERKGQRSLTRIIRRHPRHLYAPTTLLAAATNVVLIWCACVCVH
jgi:hypothetical protein